MKDVLLASERQLLLAPYERTPRNYEKKEVEEVQTDTPFSLAECSADWPVELNNITPSTRSVEIGNAADAATVAALREAQQDPVLALQSSRTTRKRRSGQSGEGRKRSK